MSVADDKVSGLSCSFCGIYFGHEHGYPVVCRSCWRETPRSDLDKLGLQRAWIKEL